MKFNLILKQDGQSWPDGPHYDKDPDQYALGYASRHPELEVGVMRLMNNERRRKVVNRPWDAEEKKEIAQLRKKGWDDSRIRGWMKTGNNRKGQCPPLDDRSETMATAKKAPRKKAAKKKVVKKTPARKAKGKPGRKKGAFKLGENITAVKGLDDSFYQKFPRYKAYVLLCKKGKMKTDAFVTQVEKIDGVKNRAQALGILTKLVDKGCAKMSGVAK